MSMNYVKRYNKRGCGLLKVNVKWHNNIREQINNNIYMVDCEHIKHKKKQWGIYMDFGLLVRES